MHRSSPQLKKGLVILVAVVLAPVLLVGLVALAAGDWRQIGTTEAGDKVSVSSVRVQKHNLRTAWVRVEFKEPMKLAQGGPFRRASRPGSLQLRQRRGHAELGVVLYARPQRQAHGQQEGLAR